MNTITLKFSGVDGSSLWYRTKDVDRDQALRAATDILWRVDHEGSSWEVEETDSDERVGWNITHEVERLYADACVDHVNKLGMFTKFLEHCRTDHCLPDMCCPLLPEDLE